MFSPPTLIILFIFLLAIAVFVVLYIKSLKKIELLESKIMQKKNYLHDKDISELKRKIKNLKKQKEELQNKLPDQELSNRKLEEKTTDGKNNKDSAPEKNEIKSNNYDMPENKTARRKNIKSLYPTQNDEFSSPKRSSQSHKIFCEFVNLKQGVNIKKSNEHTEWYLKKINKDEGVYTLYHVGNLKNSEPWYRIYTKMYNTPESGMEQGKKILIDYQPKYKLGENNNYRLIEKGYIKFI